MSLDRFKVEIAAFIRRVMRETGYHALTPYTVVNQAPDGTLEVTPQDSAAALPALVGVPIRHGLPGVTDVRVPAGLVVRVGFDGGDPRRPFATLWDAGNATSITVNGSGQQLARTGDDAGRTAAMATWMGAVEAALTAVGHPVTPYAGGAIGTVTGTSIVRG